MLDRDLAVFRGVADVLRGRLMDVRKLFLQGFDDLSGFIERERGLRDVRDLLRIRNAYVGHFFRAADDLRDGRRFAESADNFFVVAEASDRLLGVGLLHRSGEINLLYLAPNAQRQGMGKAIQLALEEKAQAWGLLELKLDSTALACPFYERLGYISAGAKRPRFGVLHSYPYTKMLQPNPVMQPTGRKRPAAD